MAAQWLATMGVLEPSSSALSRGARVYDLALALQDGTVLCMCANKLKSGCIPDFHEKPEKQFLKMQNINSFLAALPVHFGLKEKDLFTADQLYYASDFAKVVSCLSLLSKTQIAGIAGYKFFPAEEKVAKNTAETEDMYQSLEDLIGQSLSLEEAAKDAAPVFVDDDEEEKEEIYGAIQSMMEDNTGEVYAEMLYGEDENIYGSGATTPDEKRNCVLDEVIQTERNYVKVLQTIIECFRATFAQNSKVITKGDIRTVFSNIDELLDAHHALLADMEKVMSSSTGRMMSGCFLTHIKNLKCYGQFCCEIPDAIEKLKELDSKPATNKVMAAAKAASKQRFPLKDLLNVPMQRILKYPLLLKELIKHTPEAHPDKARLIIAKEEVDALAKYINDTKKDFDNLKKMVASLKGYTGARPLSEYGSLVKDGDLMFKHEQGKEKLKLRYVFMFSSAIILSKEKGPTFTFKSLVEFTDNQEVADIPFWTLPKDEQDGKYTYAWSLKTTDGKGKDLAVYTFATKSLQSKKKWMAAMTQCVERLKDAKVGPPQIAPRSSAPSDLPPLPTEAASPQAPAVSSRPRPAPPATVAKAPAAAAPKGKMSYEQWAPTTAPADPPPPVPKDSAVSGLGKGSGDEAWFAGKMPRAKAEKILMSLPDGSYLVRESDSRPGDYSLSIKFGAVKHIKVNREANKYELAPDAKSFPTIHELVEHFQQHSLNRHFPGMETCLEIPFRNAATYASAKATLGGEAKIAGIGRARSRFAYTAKSHDELTFERGVELIILSMEEQDPGWWKGVLPSGQVGIFPANYVQLL